MANRTVKEATSIKGTNPQYLIEKIIRSRIYDSRYWKEECFALSAELLVDKSMELRFIGGVYGGNVKPSPFLCLTLKMLQIQPEKDIVIEFIQNEDYKYVRVLGAFYMRLTGSSADIYKFLEPLYSDYRKLRFLNRAGQFELTYMDEVIDKLLNDERVCDIQLPRLQKRSVLEENNLLKPRISLLENDPDEFESDDEDDEVADELKHLNDDHQTFDQIDISPIDDRQYDEEDGRRRHDRKRHRRDDEDSSVSRKEDEYRRYKDHPQSSRVERHHRHHRHQRRHDDH